MSTFAGWDYLIFFTYLAASVLIGVWFSRGQQSLDDYFLAGRNMNRFVVAMTILAALFSGISFLAGPSEVYTSGFGFALILLSFFIATPFTAIWLLPHFCNSRYITVYQFLEERFSLAVRLFASGLFILRVSLWLAAATYAPALALREVTGMPLWFTICITGLVTTVYTMLGGMKAVIWTDVMQLFVLFGGQMLITYVAATKIPGGLGGVWDTCVANDRFALSFSIDPRERITFWSVIIGGTFLSLVQMATDQVSVQRYLTAGSLREAQRALWIKLWMVLPVLVLFYGTGLVLYAFYQHHGDPLAAGQITRGDQILPYFVVTQLPVGLPGLLIAAIFAASMSTVSAGVNSLTSATLCDFYQRLTPPNAVSERGLIIRARCLTLLFGVIVTAAAFGISAMKTNLVESVNSIIGLVGGPLLGLFLLGVFTKRVNARGAFAGCLAGFVALIFLFFYKTAPMPGATPAPLVSFLWFTMIGCCITMAVGWFASGGGKRKG
ncbi:MAG: sodium/solute symporter [Chthoniobacteraceae bacterium]